MANIVLVCILDILTVFFGFSFFIFQRLRTQMGLILFLNQRQSIVNLFQYCLNCCYRSRFWKEIVHSSLFAGSLFICISCVTYYKHIFLNSSFFLILFDLFASLYSIHYRHLKIHNYDFVQGATFLIRASLYHLQSFFSIDSFITCYAKFANKYLLQNISIHVNIIDNENLSTIANRYQLG